MKTNLSSLTQDYEGAYNPKIIYLFNTHKSIYIQELSTHVSHDKQIIITLILHLKKETGKFTCSFADVTAPPGVYRQLIQYKHTNEPSTTSVSF